MEVVSILSSNLRKQLNIYPKMSIISQGIMCACSDRNHQNTNPILLFSSIFPDFFLRVYLFRAVLTFLFFVLSGCCAVLRSVPLSTLCPAVLTLGALGMSVWRCARTERAGLLVLAGAQYISRRRSSQLWKQHSSTMPRDRRALGP